MAFGQAAAKKSGAQDAAKQPVAQATAADKLLEGMAAQQELALVERFDTELNPDFSAKSPNFRGLVLFCIEADFCTQIRIFQHFSRTTRIAILCTAPISKFEQNFVKLLSDFCRKFCKNRDFSKFFHRILHRF